MLKTTVKNKTKLFVNALNASGALNLIYTPAHFASSLIEDATHRIRHTDILPSGFVMMDFANGKLGEDLINAITSINMRKFAPS